MKYGWRDLLFILLLIFILKIQPVGEMEQQEVQSPGQISIEAFWPDGWTQDVDLWLRAPNDGVIWYMSKNGHIFDLLRDDRGEFQDPTSRNYEFATTRSAPEGEYIVNLVLYNGEPPVPVEVTIRYVGSDGKAKLLFHETVTLESPKQELTVVRFHFRDGMAYDRHATPIRLTEAVNDGP